MKLNSNSKLVKWAYLGDYIPSQTSLCPFFWRVVFITPLKITAAGVITTAVFMAFFVLPVQLLGWAGLFTTPTVVGALILVVWLRNRNVSRESKPPSILGEWVRAKKAKVCSIITLSDD